MTDATAAAPDDRLNRFLGAYRQRIGYAKSARNLLSRGSSRFLPDRNLSENGAEPARRTHAEYDRIDALKVSQF